MPTSALNQGLHVGCRVSAGHAVACSHGDRTGDCSLHLQGTQVWSTRPQASPWPGGLTLSLPPCPLTILCVGGDPRLVQDPWVPRTPPTLESGLSLVFRRSLNEI